MQILWVNFNNVIFPLKFFSFADKVFGLLRTDVFIILWVDFDIVAFPLKSLFCQQTDWLELCIAAMSLTLAVLLSLSFVISQAC